MLLQRGKGADAGAGFGAGASGTVFGARGRDTALSRATAILAAVFMINSLALAYLGTQHRRRSRSTRFSTRPLDAEGAGALPAHASTPAPTPTHRRPSRRRHRGAPAPK